MSKFEGTVEEIVFRNDTNGFTVISFKPDGSGRISAVGIMPFLSTGEHVILDGDLVEHRDYGRQIRVNAYETTRPETKSGVEKYLGSGLIKGVGPATAKLIVSRFGKDTLDILEAAPERLIEIPGIGPKRAAMIAESFAMHNEMRTTLIFLQNAGLAPSVSMKVYRCFGDRSESVLRTNPYRMADEIDGIGFKTADRIALDMGFLPDSPQRLESGVLYVLSEAVHTRGHMFLPYDVLRAHSRETLGADDALLDDTIRTLILRDRLRLETVGGEKVVYLPRIFQVECEAANLLLELRASHSRVKGKVRDAEAKIAAFERENGVQLCDQQKAAVTVAVNGALSIITGGPGTGKTTSINCILALLEPDNEIELCAPTGRAARRMSDATGRTARTIHRMLEYSGEIEDFQKNEDEPLRADVVIVDEMSMVDIFLMRSLLRALKPGTRLIMVGDADQLPSVGAGNVLKDIIASGVIPVVCLEEIFRQGQESRIIVNAHRINRGQYPLIRNRDTDFFLERRDSVQSAAESVVALVKTRLPNYLGVDCLRGIQVMAPMKKGDLGVFKLNELLQEALNPPARNKGELARGDILLREGDKVMQVRNNYDIEWTRGCENGMGVFNGDFGFIEKVSRADREVTVEFDDGRRAIYDEGLLDELELSYCISVHKSQGSEFDAVVLPLIAGPQMLMTRNLLYTAVTRAKRLVVIVGREGCVQDMVDNDRIMLRYSALEERLKALD